jgi:hypothetical protein
MWLNGLTDDAISRMSAADATRLLDVAVRVERAATPAVGDVDVPDRYSEPPETGFGQRLAEAGLDVELSELARLIHEKLKSGRSVSEPDHIGVVSAVPFRTAHRWPILGRSPAISLRSHSNHREEGPAAHSGSQLTRRSASLGSSCRLRSGSR